MSGSLYTTVFGSGGPSAPNATQTAFDQTVTNSETFGNGAVIIANTGAGGLKIGTGNTQKMALWGATPVVQPATNAELTGLSGNAATAANAANMTTNGNTGATAYNLSDVVKALKQAGVLAS